MKPIVIALASAAYVVGFVSVFLVNSQLPVTLGLALARAALWPIWIATGKPKGAQLPMD